MAPHQIVLFLELVQQARAAGRLTYRRKRDKNRETLLSLGCTITEMFDHVTTLKPEQALLIPRANRHPGHAEELLCEFGTRIEGQDIYVKVTIVAQPDGPAGCVISFHPAESPLEYPFA